ncbi:MAG: response regulator [Cyclobacteriaceae bacterium]
MQRKILVIDGDHSTRKNTTSILKLGGYEVLEASEGKSGLETAIQEIPDLILCDLEMPGLDGSGVLHVLGKNPETASIPFVLQGNKASIIEFREGMNLGADDFLLKPFESTDLLKVVEVRINRRDLFKGLIEPEGDIIEQYFKQERNLRELERLTDHRIYRIMRRKEIIYMDGQSP